jgi:single-strand DNA-binding protein
MNKIILIGNITKDIEVRATATGLKTASFSLAINEGKDKNGQEQVQYFNCTAFDKTADVMEKYCKKGHKICVEGKLKNRSWDDKETGQKRYATDITVNNIEMLTSKVDAERIANNSQSDEPTSSRPTVAKSNDLPEIDVNSINVQMPF